MKRWKIAEKKAAKAFGVERNIRINFGEEGPDTTEHEVFSIEVKSRKKISTFLKNGLIQAKSYYPDKLPLMVVYEAWARDGIVVMNLTDFQKLLELQNQLKSGSDLDAVLEISMDDNGKYKVQVKQ